MCIAVSPDAQISIRNCLQLFATSRQTVFLFNGICLVHRLSFLGYTSMINLLSWSTGQSKESEICLNFPLPKRASIASDITIRPYILSIIWPSEVMIPQTLFKLVIGSSYSSIWFKECGLPSTVIFSVTGKCREELG